jgi:hypothetical protein
MRGSRRGDGEGGDDAIVHLRNTLASGAAPVSECLAAAGPRMPKPNVASAAKPCGRRVRVITATMHSDNFAIV